MTRTDLVLACALATLALVGCSSNDPAPTDGGVSPKVIAPGALIDGKTYAQQSAAWWQWAIPLPKATSPIAGGDCTQGQSGNVWFLAGTSDGKPASRTCNVPAGKTLFFPLINGVCYPCHEEEGCSTSKTKAELEACVKYDATNLSLEIDGVAQTNLAAHRATSDQFSFKGSASGMFACSGPIGDNTCGIPKGDRFGVSDGYWIAIEPLAAGTHTIKFKATYPGDGTATTPDFVQDVQYTLTVK
jgi:hypothetical protein